MALNFDTRIKWKHGRAPQTSLSDDDPQLAPLLDYDYVSGLVSF